MSEKRVNNIFRRQEEFQELCEVNIHTLVASEVNELSEMYLFKAIEEIVELRKTFPSELNKWSKNQGSEKSLEIMSELSDVALFLINFMLVRKIMPRDLLSAIEYVQGINFLKLKTKKMSILDDEVARIPNKTMFRGVGDLEPKAIFVFLCPELDEQGYEKNLQFLIKALISGQRMPEDYYITYLIKEPLLENVSFDTQLKFWAPFLKKELEILKKGNPVAIYAIGSKTYATLAKLEFPANFSALFKGSGIELLMGIAKAIEMGLSPEEYYTRHLSPYLPEEVNDAIN